MGRKRHDKLTGLPALGAKLRQLREKAGLSQMRLAAKMGFAPTHGYKYIFRLEKGQVPNPTLRTIATYLEACGAGWQEIADLLPASATQKQPIQQPAKHAEVHPEPPPARPRDTRPQRLRIRTELLTKRQERAQAFWARFERVEQQIAEVLHKRGVVSNQQRHYFAFLRSCCLTIDSYSGLKPGLLDQQLGKLVRSAREAGLDEKILLAIRDICLESMSQPGGSGH